MWNKSILELVPSARRPWVRGPESAAEAVRCPLDIQVKRNALGTFFHFTHPCLPGHLQIYLNMNKPKNTVCQKSRRIWLMLTPGGPPPSLFFFANYSKQPLANNPWNFMTFPRYQLPGIPAKKIRKFCPTPISKPFLKKCL